MGSNRRHEIADSVFLACIMFVIGFKALECIGGLNWKQNAGKLESWSNLPHAPHSLWV